MFKPSLVALQFAATLLSSTSMPALAQGGSGVSVSRAGPADASASVPRVVHQSSFSAYRGFSDQEVKDWRESNDNVGRIGGWRTYAQESQPSKPAAKTPPPPAADGMAPKPAPGGRSPLPPPAASPSASPAVPAASGGASDAHRHH